MSYLDVMVRIIRRVVNKYYDKEMLFYEEMTGRWYSKLHCAYITIEEVEDWIEEISDKN